MVSTTTTTDRQGSPLAQFIEGRERVLGQPWRTIGWYRRLLGITDEMVADRAAFMVGLGVIDHHRREYALEQTVRILEGLRCGRRLDALAPLYRHLADFIDRANPEFEEVGQ